MAVYGFCTSGIRKGAFVPVNFRFENFRPRKTHHKIPIFLRVLWWARQGLNLRPHPCEGEWRSRVTTLFLRGKIKPPNWPCTSFVRGLFLYRRAVLGKASSGNNIAQIVARVLAKNAGSDGGPWPPQNPQKTAGRAATLRSGSLNSCAAMGESYRSGDSCASAVCGGGSR